MNKMVDRVFKSAGDTFVDSFTPVYKKPHTDLRIGCFYPVIGKWMQGSGYSAIRNDLVSGTDYMAGGVLLRCLSRIHSEDLKVTITYRKARIKEWVQEKVNEKNIPRIIYEEDPIHPTEQVSAIIPAYSERGSLYLTLARNAYGIVSIDVETTRVDYPSGLPGDSFEIIICASPTVAIGQSVGEMFDKLRKDLETTFRGRFVHLRKCATCDGTGIEGTHGGTSACPVCGGSGVVGIGEGDTVCPNCAGRGTVCPTCLGATVDEMNARYYHLVQRSKDLGARKKAVDEDPKITAMRAWSRRIFVHPTIDDIRKRAAFFTGCSENSIEIVEDFDHFEPTFFIFAPYFGGPLNLFTFGRESRNDFVEWAETIRPVGIHVITGVYFPIDESLGDFISDYDEDDRFTMLEFEDSPFPLYGEFLPVPLLFPDSGKQAIIHDRPEPGTGITVPGWGTGDVVSSPTWTYSSIVWPGLWSRVLPSPMKKGSFYSYFQPNNHAFRIRLQATSTSQVLLSSVKSIIDPKIYFEFEEGSGNSVVDSSGNGNDATLDPVEWTTDSAIGDYAVDDGTTVRVPYDSSYELSDEFTISVWLKPTQVMDYWDSILALSIGISNTSAYVGGNAYLTTGTMQFDGSTSQNIDPDNYNHLVIQWKVNENPVFYVNGNAVSTECDPPEPSYPLAPSTSYGLSIIPSGPADSFMLFSRKITESEIQALLLKCTQDCLVFNDPFSTSDIGKPLRLTSGEWLYIFTRFDFHRKKLHTTIAILKNDQVTSTSKTKSTVIDLANDMDELNAVEFIDDGGSGDGYISEFSVYPGDVD